MITCSAATAPHILSLGRAGLARAEIVSELGLTLAEAAEREAADADFARAMELAEEAAQAWWTSLQREAVMAGARLGQGAWRDAMRWRFGEGLGAWVEPPAPPAPEKPARREAIFDLPDNGTKREYDAFGRLLNGTPAHARILALRNADYAIRRYTRELEEAAHGLEGAKALRAKIEAAPIETFDEDDYDEESDDDDDDQDRDEYDDFE